MKFSISKKRLALILLAAVGLLVLSGAVAILIFLNSERFREQARLYVEHTIEQRTGGRTSLKSLRWNLSRQRFELEGLTVHGLEPAGQPALAHVDRIELGISFRSLMRRHLHFFDFQILRPEFHVVVDAHGKTNLPQPSAPAPQSNFNFQVSADNFRVSSGEATINERRIGIDFAIANLDSTLRYNGNTGVVSSRLGYNGTLHLENGPAIPYNLSGELDYTRGVMLWHRLEVKSGLSLVKLQGRINDSLTENIAGKLAYSGSAAIPFLNHFYPDKHFDGAAGVAGELEFSKGFFSTAGTATIKSTDYAGWNAREFKGRYSYRYPARRLEVRDLSVQIAGGSAAGSIDVETLPGSPRVTMDLDYLDVDSAALSRVYPWDPSYQIYSRLSGKLAGWFEGDFERFHFSGAANLTSYPPAAAQGAQGTIVLPVDGATEYEFDPGQAVVRNGMFHFRSSNAQIDGLIHPEKSELKVSLTSSNLADFSFLYRDANGAGSFDGALSGPIKTPVAAGQFNLTNHKYRQWTIQEAAGRVRLDTLTEMAELRDVRVAQGSSTVTINGSTTLDGKTVNLRLETPRFEGPEITSFAGRRIGGTFAGAVQVTSLAPLRVEGDNVRAQNLDFEGRLIGDVRARVRYREPVIELDNLMVTNRGATLAGNITYNTTTEDLGFSLGISSPLNLDMIRDLGLPPELGGVIQRANFTGKGTRAEPNVSGRAEIQNLSFHGESFPSATVQLSSAGSVATVIVDAGAKVNMTVRINTAAPNLPFEGSAKFTGYSVERLAGLAARGTLTLTGRADHLKGALRGPIDLSGDGQIETAEAVISERPLRARNPFGFRFDSTQLVLPEISISDGTNELSLEGTIPLTRTDTLDLTAKGQLNLAVLTPADSEWMPRGIVALDGRVGGTLQEPDLRGNAHLSNASFSRAGFSTSLTGLTGDVFFNEKRVQLLNLKGSAGAGTIVIGGDAVIQKGQVDSMNIAVDANGVRVRYPEGLRAIIDGSLVLRGNWSSPLLEGDLQVRSMAYRSEFETFLALFRGEGLEDTADAVTGLRLSLHVEGGQNIKIQNELADVEARVDLDIKGAASAPTITGHAETSGGTLVFQGTRYRVTRGNIDFVNPVKNEPIVDLQAESELRNYRVILTVSGRAERLRLDMRSDPPLPQLEIVNLIAGGKSREELASASAATGLPSSEQLFQGGAASILFDLLKSRVGSKLGLLGLPSVRVDPFLVGAENNPSARITVPLQVTKDLSVTYSQDLTSSRQQIIQLEYVVSQNVSVVASRDETGALGLDVKLRKRF